MTPLAAARRYVDKSWSPIPVPRGRKGPVLPEWQKLRLSAADLARYFVSDCNVGLLTGSASSGLIDIDLDSDLAVRLADAFLPDTKMRSGRGSRPRSHWWYRVDGSVPPSVTVRDVDGRTTLLELRADGHQTLVPPSVHPEGDAYEWDGPLEPALVDVATLETGFRRLAAAVLVTLHWPRVPGSRHEIASALAGMLIRARWTDSEVVRFVGAVARAAGDDEVADRVRTIASTAKRLRQGGNVTGAPTLARLLGVDLVDHVREQLGVQELSSFKSFMSYRDSGQPPWPNPISNAAYHGLAGRFVTLVEPHTESDPVAILVQFLVGFGNLIGRGAHFKAEADRHYTNLFAAFVGDSSKGRKGTSKGHVDRLLREIDEPWHLERQQSGLSSGEGLIWAVRDPITSRTPVREKGRVVGYDDIESDPGVADKRLLAFEPELAATLRVLGRDGNTLSPVIRQAWDSGNLQILTKNSPAKSTGAHISVIGHITRDELRRYLDRTETGNGFANRYLWICVRRSKLLPEGGRIDTVDFSRIHEELVGAVRFVRSLGAEELSRDDDARRLWYDVYPKLSAGGPGLHGAVTSRAEAQVMRLALIYALLDGCARIQRPHLEAALAVWSYCDASASHIFGDALGDPIADAILRSLREHTNGLTRSEIRDLFKRNQEAARIDRALGLLEQSGRARCVREDTGGRPAERWYAASEYDLNDINDQSPVTAGPSVVSVVNVVPHDADSQEDRADADGYGIDADEAVL